uniref:Uncharacterized protein n=1 Tax=Anopheles farauti TaxID=69004 RepID=A0A182QHF3_9DIPT
MFLPLPPKYWELSHSALKSNAMCCEPADNTLAATPKRPAPVGPAWPQLADRVAITVCGLQCSGFSKVGLRSPQQVGLMSPFPVGLNRSSSPPGSGSAGSGGSPKHGPTPPEAATSNRDGGSAKPTYFSTSGGTWNTSVSTSVGVWSSLSDGSSSFFGRSMHSTLGSSSIKTRCTHGAIRCVTGDLMEKSELDSWLSRAMRGVHHPSGTEKQQVLPKVDIQYGDRDDDG